MAQDAPISIFGSIRRSLTSRTERQQRSDLLRSHRAKLTDVENDASELEGKKSYFQNVVFSEKLHTELANRDILTARDSFYRALTNPNGEPAATGTFENRPEYLWYLS